jgi:hypothetical protein
MNIMNIKMNKKLLYTLVLFLFLSIPITGGVLQDEIDLEESLRSSAQRSVDGVFGPNNFIIQVDAKLTTPKYEVKYTKESNPVRTKKKKKDENYSILPGYSVIKNLAPSDMQKLPFDSVTNYIKPRVVRVLVSVIVNKKFPKGKVGRAKSLIKKVLELNDKRGDKVDFKFQKFYVDPDAGPQSIKIVPNDKLLSFQNFFNLGFFILLLVFIVIYIIFQMRKTEEGEKGGDAGPNISVNPNIELPKGMGGGSSGNLKMSNAPAIKQYFDFVDDENIDKVISLLKKEKVGLEYINYLTSFLQPRLAAKLLTELDLKSQAILAVNMLDQKMVNKEVVEKFEEKVKLWLESLAGGDQVFLGVFDLIPSENKKKMLELLGKSNAEGYKKVRSNIILFDDLKFLDDDEIKTILSELNMELLSVALCSIEDETYQAIDRNLIKTSKAMVEQYLRLKGATVSKKEIEVAQASILEVVSKLESEGKVNLKDKIKL